MEFLAQNLSMEHEFTRKLPQFGQKIDSRTHVEVSACQHSKDFARFMVKFLDHEF